MAKDPGREPPGDSSSDDSGAAHDAHEALCRRCGMSCHFAVPVNGLAVVIDALHCKFLGRASDAEVQAGAGRYHCTVYERRFEVAPWCHTAESALAGGFLAQDCPYARGTPGYRGKVRLSPSLLRKVLPAIRGEVARAGIPSGADPDDALRFLQEGESEGGAWRYTLSDDGSRYCFERRVPPESATESAPESPPESPPASNINPATESAAASVDASEASSATGRRSTKLRVL